MNRTIIFVLLFASLTACSFKNNLSESPTTSTGPTTQDEPSGESTTAVVNPEKIVPITYSPAKLNTAVITESTTEEIKVLKEIKLNAASVILYSKENDDQNFYAGLQIGNHFFQVDGIIGYGNPDDTEVLDIDLNGIPLIKIRGSQGASAPITSYIKIVNGAPQSFIQLDKYSEEYDLYNDGKKVLIVTSGGTIPETEIINANNDQLESANLNELMQGKVAFDHEKKQLIVYKPNQQAEIYKLTTKGLEYVSTMNT